MTYVDAQHLLCVLMKDNPIQCDGIWGPKSKAAMKEFQTKFGIHADGMLTVESGKALRHAVAYWYDEVDASDIIVGDKTEPTGIFWDEIEFFDRDEFKCKCGGKYCNGYPAEPDERMVRIVNQLRKNLGVPITIVSGLRCKTWNAIQGGVSNSQHMYGEAADIYAKGVPQSRVEAELDNIGGVRYHYAIAGSSNVHFDVPKGNR
jgi:peptidoglycan hydrolase-like protein with peptidoglycan-binding domain